MNLSRKDFLKVSGAGLAAAAAGGTVQSELHSHSLLGRSSGPRVVVAGGGWGGLTVAKYLKRANRDIDVVLIEQRSQFMSCPVSNEWLADNVPLDFISFDFNQPAERYGYRFVNERITGISRFRKRVMTTGGSVNYDYLVLAPGIAYRYEDWFGDDIDSIRYCQNRYPASYIPGEELLTLKRKIQNFEQGDFVMTVPEGPYRCPPGPYERACMIAGVFKKNRVKGNLILLDPKPDVQPKGPGFKAAFQELYRDQIVYVPNAKIQRVDPYSKKIYTTAGEFDFDDANLTPKQKPGALLDMAGGMIDETGWGSQNELTCLSSRDDNVYIVGDAFGHPLMPKSGAMANALGKNVAADIVMRIAGQEATLERGLSLPQSTCYSIVNSSPREGLAITAIFEWDSENNKLARTMRSESQRTTAAARATTEWARGSFADMFM